MQSFTTQIQIINGNPYVQVPKKLLEIIFKDFGKNKGPIPVKGKLNEAPFTQTLVRYQGDWRLYINGIMLKNAKIYFKTSNIISVVGKEVKVELAADSKSRKLPMHPKLATALSKDPKAQKSYKELPPYRKHEILKYLGFLKTEESIDKNIGRIIKHLKGEEIDALYPLMHRKKQV